MLIEGILTLVIVILVLVMVGIPLDAIIGIAVSYVIPVILALAVGLFVLFFLITGLSLLFFRKEKGVFVRFDDARYERAVYAVNGTEYTCIFPAENIARRTIYQKNSEHILLISRFQKRRTAFDRHSLFIIGIGITASCVMTAAAVILWIRFF